MLTLHIIVCFAAHSRRKKPAEVRLTCGLAEAEHLEEGNVEGEKEVEGVLHDGGGAADAVLRALQPQRSPDLVKHQPLGQRPAPRQRLTATCQRIV